MFELVGAGESSLLITGFFGFVKVVACGFFLIALVERIGRRGALFLGALLMGIYMLIVAILTAKFPPNPDEGLTSPAIASITMIYLEAMAYNISWGAVSWIYVGEMFPSRIREAGTSIGVATQVSAVLECRPLFHTPLPSCADTTQVVVQLCVLVHHTSCRGESRMEDLPHVRNL